MLFRHNLYRYNEGNGLLSGELAPAAARRMSSTGFDYEYEIYRFEEARDTALAAMKKKGTEKDRARETAPAVAAAAEVLEAGALHKLNPVITHSLQAPGFNP